MKKNYFHMRCDSETKRAIDKLAMDTRLNRSEVVRILILNGDQVLKPQIASIEGVEKEATHVKCD